MNIGIFGGAFDPFHQGHREIVECAQRELHLDMVVLLPSFAPPHKESKLSAYAVRREMARVGIMGLNYVLIDDLEMERNTVNPTSVVLPLLKEKYPCDNFYYIMGGDSAVNFPSWIQPQKIADTARLAVVSRAGSGNIVQAADNLKKTYGAAVSILSYQGDWVSSSVVKASFELGLRPNGVSEEVIATIEKNKLYTRFHDLVSRLKSDLPEHTYLHSVRTVLYAQRFTGLLKLKFEDVFLACFLHDCAKHLPAVMEEVPRAVVPQSVMEGIPRAVVHQSVMEGVPRAVVHQFTGAERASDTYGVTDENVLDAIRFHTSGKANMSTLGKLVYCADMLESGRDFLGVQTLRKIMNEDFDRGFVNCINATNEHLKSINTPIFSLTKECVEYYNNKEPQKMR